MDGGSVCMVSFLVILVFDHRRGFIRNITSNTWTYMLLAPEQLDASGFFFRFFFESTRGIKMAIVKTVDLPILVRC
jgi:hypothetical protein